MPEPVARVCASTSSEVASKIRLSERKDLAIAQISAWRDTAQLASIAIEEVTGTRPPDRPNTVSYGNATRILWVGPDQWITVSESSIRDQLSARLRTPEAAIVELSASRRVFVLSGSQAPAVLAKLLPLDLTSPDLAPGRCALSAAAHIGMLLHVESKEVFELFVYRGFAQHFVEILTDAGEEFGLQPPR